jgi:hypothetical protein
VAISLVISITKPNGINQTIIMAQTQTNELTKGVASVARGVSNIAADRKVNFGDIPEVLVQLPVVAAAVEGFDQVGDELAAATIADKEERLGMITQELTGPNLNADTAYDLGSLIHGVTNAASMFIRNARRRQLEESAVRLQEMLSSQEVAIAAGETVDLDYCKHLLGLYDEA